MSNLNTKHHGRETCEQAVACETGRERTEALELVSLKKVDAKSWPKYEAKLYRLRRFRVPTDVESVRQNETVYFFCPRCWRTLHAYHYTHGHLRLPP